MQEAYIVAGYRTAVGKSKRGKFRFYRPDDMAIDVIKGLLASVPQLDPARVDDVIVGNAVPEAEQGLQVGRIIAARAVGIHAPGVTVNRYCASGLETIAMATAKIRSGMAECITAGNSSQTSDGAAFVIVMGEKMVNELGLKPIARLVACASAGVHPRIMGIGPVEAVPKALRQAGMNLGQIDLVELNEAFASQALAVIRKLEINPGIVNINGGAIALGHPLGCTGCKLTIQLVHDMKRLNKKYGIVTACVRGGQGIACIIENLN